MQNTRDGHHEGDESISEWLETLVPEVAAGTLLWSACRSFALAEDYLGVDDGS